MEIDTTHIAEIVTPWIIRGGIALVVFIIGKILARWISNRLGRFLEKQGLNTLLVRLSKTAAYCALMLLVILAALEQIGIDTTSALAVFGAASLAVGLAVKDSLSNFASGVLIVVFEPFSIDHYIEAGGSSGTVVEVGLFNTILLTPDNKRVIVPNSVIYNGTIVNYSAEDIRRLDLVFGIGYEDDINQARDLIMDIIQADGRALKDPEPLVAVGELADNSVNLNVRPWVTKEDYWRLRADLLESIKIAFDVNGISIPYPQRDVHLYSEAP